VHGISFRIEVTRNDIGWSRLASRFLALRFDNRVVHGGWVRKGLRVLPRRLRDRLGSARLPWLRWARPAVDGVRPNLVFHDTGGRIQQWCESQGWTFANQGIPPANDSAVIRGYSSPGLTTRLLREGPGSPALAEPERELRAALRDRYGIDWDAFASPAWSLPNPPRP
jgi:hypothetical protein